MAQKVNTSERIYCFAGVFMVHIFPVLATAVDADLMADTFLSIIRVRLAVAFDADFSLQFSVQTS